MSVFYHCDMRNIAVRICDVVATPDYSRPQCSLNIYIFKGYNIYDHKYLERYRYTTLSQYDVPSKYNFIAPLLFANVPVGQNAGRDENPLNCTIKHIRTGI
jgi:hypothetical protein